MYWIGLSPEDITLIPCLPNKEEAGGHHSAGIILYSRHRGLYDHVHLTLDHESGKPKAIYYNIGHLGYIMATGSTLFYKEHQEGRPRNVKKSSSDLSTTWWIPHQSTVTEDNHPGMGASMQNGRFSSLFGYVCQHVDLQGFLYVGFDLGYKGHVVSLGSFQRHQGTILLIYWSVEHVSDVGDWTFGPGWPSPLICCSGEEDGKT